MWRRLPPTIWRKKPPLVNIDHPLATFKSGVMASDQPARLLLPAIAGSEDALAKLAFDLAEKGVAAAEVSAWLVPNCLTLPGARQVIAMNFLLQRNATEREPVIRRIFRQGTGDARLEAVEKMGFVAQAEEVEALSRLYLGGDEALAKAAFQGLLKVPEERLGAVIARHLADAHGRETGGAQKRRNHQILTS